ncbi:hypothetical protein DSO57_1016588 [Entomophthora muscae]|uniref:Uncharacterized protein n=1 Tax=Entomophthora muscae TaxID=34485 RepID=A0ACC2TSE0_9FUNG|nr:hypothetical protein DSO57_1016588 [Entomophthora muscae]
MGWQNTLDHHVFILKIHDVALQDDWWAGSISVNDRVNCTNFKGQLHAVTKPSTGILRASLTALELFDPSGYAPPYQLLLRRVGTPSQSAKGTPLYNIPGLNSVKTKPFNYIYSLFKALLTW